MTTVSSSLPSRAALTAALSGILGAPVAIAKRRRNAYSSSFPSEIVKCRLADGELTVLCKYGAGPADAVYGHKGGVVYEAEVYRHILQALSGRLTLATFHGASTDADSGHTWLVLEYLHDTGRLHKTDDPNAALIRAAGWIGEFHALSQRLLSPKGRRCLNAHGRDYYRGWAQRTIAFAGVLHQRFRWLRQLCEGFEKTAIPLLLDRPPAVIHGEYYPKNVLLRGTTVYPVDWESAALAAGEIDLAMLTEGWSADVTRCCEQEYARRRWPEGAPANFSETLTAARMYGLLRWLGDNPELTASRGTIGQVKQLGLLGEQLGVI